MKKILISILLMSMVVVSYADDAQFLAKPTGSYGVGFKDFHFQDNGRCPDVYAQRESTKPDDFSPDNLRQCREIMVRVYYPTNDPISQGDLYYQPIVTQTKVIFNGIIQFLNNHGVNIAVDLDYRQLASLKTYSHENAMPTSGQFPVVIFNGGAQNPAQDYENLISDTVSHGYVVIGVNSVFLNGYITLPDGCVVTTDYSSNPAADDIATRSSDIMYIYNQLAVMNKQLANIMETDNVGLMGHSQGANAIAALMGSANAKYFQAAVVQDADVQENFPAFTKPFLHELSGSRYWVVYYGPPDVRVSYIPKYTLNKNNYLVGIVPDLDSLINPAREQSVGFYSVHGSFTDWSTQQYTSAFQNMVPAFSEFYPFVFEGNSPGYMWGAGNGFAISYASSGYAIQFFDTYLKGKTNPVFNTNNCQPLIANTIISCGPTVFPYQ